MADNGPRRKRTTGRNRNTLINIKSKGGKLPSALDRPKQKQINAFDTPTTEQPPAAQSSLVGAVQQARRERSSVSAPSSPGVALQTSDYTPGLQALAAAQQGQAQAAAAVAPAISKNQPKGVMRQIARGFAAAGDERMARFVRRHPQLVRIWLNQESSMNPHAISPPNNQGDPNYGGFQFARLDPGARPWLEQYIRKNGQKFTASWYEQAQLAARYFDLTPGDVRRYVQQIRQGTYKGWG